MTEISLPASREAIVALASATCCVDEHSLRKSWVTMITLATSNKLCDLFCGEDKYRNHALDELLAGITAVNQDEVTMGIAELVRDTLLALQEEKVWTFENTQQFSKRWELLEVSTIPSLLSIYQNEYKTHGNVQGVDGSTSVL